MRPPLMALNLLLWVSSAPGACCFRASLGRVERVQLGLLLQMLRQNEATAFGRRHGFSGLADATRYRDRVPLRTYEDYAPWVRRAMAGEVAVLTRERPLTFQPTGGSTASSKFIPLTPGLLRQFQRGLAPWIAALYRRHPSLLMGQAYWSLTPNTLPSGADGRAGAGFAEDRDYFGPFVHALLGPLMAAPPGLAAVSDPDAFLYATALFLLRARRLALISVWNPTFLSLVVERLWANREALCRDLERGTLSVAPSGPVLESLGKGLRPDRHRARAVREALFGGGEIGEAHARLWPHLGLISCWADGPSAMQSEELKALFPHVPLQPKGLLATEAFVTAPDGRGEPGWPLAFRSHFFEFLPEGGGPSLLAHELPAGGRFSVVVTTAGGLYRYRLQDLVEVTGHSGGCPRLRFLGKEDQIADRFGEKLHEGHVRCSLERAFALMGVRPAFALVAYEGGRGGGRYVLFVEAPGAAEASLMGAARALEEGLKDNFHYLHCRALGQLGPVQAFRVERGGRAAYLAGCTARGQRMGEVKASSLDRRDGWADVFRGSFVGRVRQAREEGGGGWA